MLETMKRLVQVCTAVIVIAVLAFGTAQALERDVCGDEPGEIGLCPPYNKLTCAQDCFMIYQSTGSCIGNPSCCTCQV